MSNALSRDVIDTGERIDATVLTPMTMLNQAVSQGASIEVLEKLMGLQERYEANQRLRAIEDARRAFDEAVSDAKAEIPIIGHNRKGNNDKRYADFSAYARVIDPILAKHGLSYRFRTEQADRISVTCILSHKLGHSESNTLSGPPDKTGSKNDIQAIGSTLTYLQRYTLVQALGLAAGEDDDGKKAVGGVVNDEQAKRITDLALEVKANVPKMLEMFDAESIADIRAADFSRVIGKLEAKRAADAARAKEAQP